MRSGINRKIFRVKSTPIEENTKLKPVMTTDDAIEPHLFFFRKLRSVLNTLGTIHISTLHRSINEAKLSNSINWAVGNQPKLQILFVGTNFHKDFSCARIFKQSMEARTRVEIGLSYRPARLHRMAESIP